MLGLYKAEVGIALASAESETNVMQPFCNLQSEVQRLYDYVGDCEIQTICICHTRGEFPNLRFQGITTERQLLFHRELGTGP